MRVVKKFKEGEPIPQGAVYLKSVEEKDPSKLRIKYTSDAGFLGLGAVPIFGEMFQNDYKVTYYESSTYHYYVVEV